MKTPKRILICNRGEIAIRVAKAINELGHVSIGLYTDNEPEAFHLSFCQEWLHLSGSTNSETYLNFQKIVDLIKVYKIDAVHPGYGFLSENTKFAKLLEDMGVIFIGPHAKAVELMGDKAVSKKIAKEAGVPVVPGSVGEIHSVEEAQKIASEIGYPVLLKAVAGGGGKGMRVCENPQELSKNFDAVRREALSSFGNDGVLVEKFIVNPHHIEVQILADKFGNVFHFFERECSVQRRHQKIIEEAPSPFVGNDEVLREKITATAVKLARAVNYDSAGTVELIMGEDKNFYFLEMNTRIQVEHPITEEITGVDLLSNMIRVAFKEKLDFQSQEEIKISGHAIECRLCAEDPTTMLPAPGVVNGFHYEDFPGLRFDHCIYNGLEVKSDFDPMIGKIITKGFNRSVAVRKMRYALEKLFINGIKTNHALHQVILTDDLFVKGIYTTNFITEREPHLKLARSQETENGQELEKEFLESVVVAIEAQNLF
jgi:acetyl-CoA carboxylase biotin carboxylase subunit